jgi:hypothetical protein
VLNAIFALHSDLVLFLRNLHGDYTSLLEQVWCNTKTLGFLSQQSQPAPYMFYGQPFPFNAAPSNVLFNAVHPGVSFKAAPSSVAMNAGIPAAVTAHSGTYMKAWQAAAAMMPKPQMLKYHDTFLKGYLKLLLFCQQYGSIKVPKAINKSLNEWLHNQQILIGG